VLAQDPWADLEMPIGTAVNLLVDTAKQVAVPGP
jgi:hypothetical protein